MASLLALLAAPVQAQVAAGYSEYYIPGDEVILEKVLDELGQNNAVTGPTTPEYWNDQGPAMHTIITVTAWSENTTVYYDHWENCKGTPVGTGTCTTGYNFDPADPTTADETVVLASTGNRQIFEDGNIPTNPRGTAEFYDGGDRIYVAGGVVTVTRSSWIENTGTVQALAWEIYPVKPQLTTYILPFGEDLALAAGKNLQDFERVYVLIQATEDTTFTVDLDANGTWDPLDLNRDGDTADAGEAGPFTLLRGATFLLDRVSGRSATGRLNTGTLIQGGSTLQLKFIIGDESTNYEARGLSAFPRGYWTKEYYAPVGNLTGGAGRFTDIFLYNPNASTITITYETAATTGTFTIGPGETDSYRSKVGALPAGGGVYLAGTDVFWGISTIDSTGQTQEWAYSLLPMTMLYAEHYLGWAQGAYPVNPPPDANADDSGAFLTVTQDNTRVFVDYDNDGTADRTYTLNRLASQYITDTTDGDLSQAHVWATGPFTMAFGENPNTADTGAPAVDLGYVSIPGTDFISLVLSVDKSVSPQVVSTASGSWTTFTVKVNSRKYTVDEITANDYLPPGWSYTNGVDTTKITRPDRTIVTTGTDPTPSGSTLTWSSAQLTGSAAGHMDENQEITIEFTAHTTAILPAGTLSQNRVKATGTREVPAGSGFKQIFNATDFAYVAAGDLTIGKSSNAPTPAYPGDQFTYAVKVTNGAAAQTGVSFYDPLPAGVSYVAASSAVTCDITSNVRDLFGTQAYNNNNGTRNWAGDWTETDRYGNGATGAGGGYVSITPEVLQLRSLATNTSDNFQNPADSWAATNGTNPWDGPWVETGSGNIRNDGNVATLDQCALGDAITRTATLTGATSAVVNFTLTDSGLEANENVEAHYQLDSGAWVLVGTLYGSDGSFRNAPAPGGADPRPLTIPLPSGTNKLTLRFQATGSANWNAGNDEALVDNVNIAYYPTVGTRVQRTVNLRNATTANLTFSFAATNLGAGDQVVVEASSDGTNFTPLETFSSGTPAAPAARSYNLIAPTSYASANTTIRFSVSGGFTNATETFSVDDVDITYSPTTLAAGTPPNLLDSGTICSSMAAGEILTATYDVTVDNPLPAGLTDVTNTVSVTSAQLPVALTASVTNNLANPSALSASVAGRVWLDDGDGVQEVGEPGIANVEVTIKDRFGTPKGTAVTDANGRYIFTGIAAGTGYYVQATDGLLAGTTQSHPAGRTDNRTAAFNLAAGQEKTGVDLGYKTNALTAAFGDLAWVDADSDAFRDAGEVGLGGVSVTLWQDAVADGILDTSCADLLPEDPPGCDTAVPGAATMTAPDGSYLFTEIPATGTETYFALAAEAAGYISTGSASHRFFNTATGSYLTADFGFKGDEVAVTTYTISDRVWLDDGDGVYEAGENGIGGVTIELLDASSNVIGTTTTATDGTFTFSGVRGGSADYTLRINDTTGVLVDHFGVTAYALGRFRDIDNLTASVDRAAPGAASFGFSVSRSIGDTVFNDSSGGAGDGVQQAGELGIAGVVVKLYRDNGASAGLLDGSDTLVGTVATDANGRYLFSGLANANYIVSVTPPSGYNYVEVLAPDTDPAAGTQRTTTISGGGNDLSADFGFRAPLQHSLSGVLWEDDNADGAIDAEEIARLAGVTIDILSGTTVVVAVTTDVDGRYSVDGLAAGAYTVRVTDAAGVLTGYFATIPAAGEQGVNLAGGNPGTADFGLRKPVPTRVFLAGFRATAAPQGVLVEWETTAEIGTVGYRILRVEGGAEVPVNERIVPAFIESRSGGRYALADPAATGSRLTYLLLEVRRTGEPVPYGPFTVTPAPATAPAKTGLAASPALADARASTRVSLALPDGKAYAREPRRRKPAPSRQTAALDLPVPQLVAVGSKVRIAVTSDGLCRLFASEIAGHLGREASEIVTRINEGSLRLSNRGVQVAYLPGDNGASLVFHGTKLDTNFTGENVYWLEVGAGRKMRWAPALAARPSAKAQHFPDRRHGEEQAWPDFQLATDPEADYWLWKFLVAGDGEFDAVVLPLDAPSPAGAGVQATLTVRLVGGNDSPANPDHHVQIRLNGAQIGETSWNGLARIDVTCAFDQGLLTGSDQIEVVALLDPGVPESFVYVDSFDLDYRRSFVAVDNRLLLTGGGNTAVTVSGFTSRAILLFDLASPNRPKLLTGATVNGSEGNYSVSFTPASPMHRYLAAARSAIGLPAAVAPWNSTGLADPANAAEYLVVTAAPLLEAAGGLAARREAQGLSAMVVTVSEIMDEFNAGIYDPAAIRSFLATAHETWAVPPRYVVLAGDGNYDYRNFLLYGPPVVPPAFVPTPYGLAAADGWYADADGDHVPEAAVGRLPAASNAELLGLVEKIAAFEDAAPGAWDTALLFAADDKDYAGDYPGDSGALIDDLPAGLATTTDYVGATTISAARTLFTDTVNAGVAHVSYFGHGGFDILADEGLVRLANEVQSLANGEMLPLFTLFTCAAGDFTDPYLVNLGEGLLLREGGGASAVLAPAGSAVHESSARLAREFFALRYGGGGGPRLGDAIVGAMRAYQFAYGGDFTLDVYNLLGDPGLRLR